jgi:hypothetical protein
MLVRAQNLMGCGPQFLPRRTPGSFKPDEVMKMLADAQHCGQR